MLVRCGQPGVGGSIAGIWTTRQPEDEQVISAISRAVAKDVASLRRSENGNHPPQNGSTVPADAHAENGKGPDASEASRPEMPLMLILDARSYLVAMANRSKGGGCESGWFVNSWLSFLRYVTYVYTILRFLSSVLHL